MKQIYFSPALLALATSTLSDVAQANTEESNISTPLETLIVTANKVPAPVLNDAQVLVIDREEIENSGSTSLTELLQSKEGFQFSRSGGALSQTNLYVRGLESKQLVFLVNGQRVGSETLGITEFQLIPLEQVERIEIIKGTRSAIYGADAQAGVINIITRNESGSTQASATLGTNQTRKASVRSSLQKEGVSAYVGVTRDQSAGFDLENDATNDADGYRRNGFNAGVRLDINDQETIGLDVQVNQGFVEFDTPWSSSDNTDFDNRAYTAHYGLTKDNLNLRAQLGRSYDQSWTYGGETSPSQGADYYETRKDTAEITGFTQLNDEHSLVFGADTQATNLNTSFITYDKMARNNKGALVGYRYEKGLVSVETGARYDDNSSYGEFWSFNHSVNLDFDNLGTLSLGQATGFKAPNFNDLYYPGFSNPELKPEQSRIWNLDYQVDFVVAEQLGQFSVSGQRALFNDQIVYNPTIFMPDNIARSYVNYASANWQQAWSENLSTELIQEWTEAKDLDSDLTLLRRPVRSTKANIHWSWNAWKTSVESLYRGESEDAFFNTTTFTTDRTKVSAFALYNLAVSYQATEALNINLRVENLADREYQTIFGYPAQGRYAQVTGRYRF